MRSTWQGKAGRSPLQALYESDQVKGQGEGDGGGGGGRGSGVLEVDPFFHPSGVQGTAVCPNTPKVPLPEPLAVSKRKDHTALGSNC